MADTVNFIANGSRTMYDPSVAPGLGITHLGEDKRLAAFSNTF